jgi:NAD(P)-dependent dehydrogenase (short-subunit alcohol dehydrogenase family)
VETGPAPANASARLPSEWTAAGLAAEEVECAVRVLELVPSVIASRRKSALAARLVEAARRCVDADMGAREDQRSGRKRKRAEAARTQLAQSGLARERLTRAQHLQHLAAALARPHDQPQPPPPTAPARLTPGAAAEAAAAGLTPGAAPGAAAAGPVGHSAAEGAEPPGSARNFRFTSWAAEQPTAGGAASGARRRLCYCCREVLLERHTFYPKMCVECGAANLDKRRQSADLSGRLALVTGARVKIGFDTVLRLLRAGCRVIGTTRFPHDALLRYSGELDFAQWAGRLELVPLDLGSYASLSSFCSWLLTKEKALDILIHNAAQTIARPPEFYRRERAVEAEPLEALLPPAQLALAASVVRTPVVQSCHFDDLRLVEAEFGRSTPTKPTAPAASTEPAMALGPQAPAAAAAEAPGAGPERAKARAGDGAWGLTAGLPAAPETAVAARAQAFPEGKLDEYGQQADLRPLNSWVLNAERVSPREAVEVMMINALSPTMMTSKLLPLLRAAAGRPRDLPASCPAGAGARAGAPSKAAEATRVSPPAGARHAFVINVSSMEGQISRGFKTAQHVHTNMAKCALNMFTRTCAQQFLRDHGVLMNAVDTGWIDDVPPQHPDFATRRMVPPLGTEDGAARVLDPIFQCLNHGIASCGVFFKDFRPTSW